MIVPTHSGKSGAEHHLKRSQRERKLLSTSVPTATHRQTKPPLAKPQQQRKNGGASDYFASASELLKNVFQFPELSECFHPATRTNTRMVYTKGVTLWMLILQRLGKGLSVESAVSHIISHDRDLLPNNKRVREETLSENSSGYQKARKNLPLDAIHEFSSAVCEYLGEQAQPLFASQRVFVIDGTTITLSPTPELKQAFPPATNQHGESVWPVARLMVAHEMQTECALLPQIDPMYGPNNVGETAQAKQIVCRLPARSIVLADAGFGIFSVAYASTRSPHNHDILFRLTHQRFKALRKKSQLIDDGPHHQSYVLTWRPSDKDRSKNPELPDDAELEVVLHQVELDNGTSLYLLSTLEINATGAAELYQHRYEVEFDIRDVKVTMDAENIRAQSVEMVKKELFTSVIAFNLVMQFRRQAANFARVEPRRLSFKGVWTSFRDRLLLKEPETLSQWQDFYAAALVSAAKRKLPNRSKPRSYPRRAHPRRPKSTKFMKAQRKKKDSVPPDPPPTEPK
jgi:hypothetical protein